MHLLDELLDGQELSVRPLLSSAFRTLWRPADNIHPFTQTHNRDTTGRITSSLTAQHETALFTEQFRYVARGRTTAHMQSFGASTGAVEHSRVWGLRYDARGHVALMAEARGVDPDQWTSVFESQVPLLNGAMAVAQRVQDGASQSQRSQHMFDVSALGTLLEEQVATFPSVVT